MTSFKTRLAKTENLPFPNLYAQQLLGELSHRAFDEEKAMEFKGKWRTDVFKKEQSYPVDVEIGTGNGYHFAHQSSKVLDRGLIGLEIKYKPLIQAIRRALDKGAEDNAFILRFDAVGLEDLFEKEEVNNVYIHHPDPWPKKRHWKHRLIQKEFLDKIYELMKPGSFLEFKTDDLPYYDWSEEIFLESKFDVTFKTRDLHKSELAGTTFITHFEKIFIDKGQPIHYLKAFKK